MQSQLVTLAAATTRMLAVACNLDEDCQGYWNRYQRSSKTTEALLFKQGSGSDADSKEQVKHMTSKVTLPSNFWIVQVPLLFRNKVFFKKQITVFAQMALLGEVQMVVHK